MLTQVYKREYETTPISLADIKAKYNIKDTVDTSDWTKSIVSSKAILAQAQPSVPQTPHNNSLVSSSDEDYNLQDDVDKAKKLIVKNALDILVHDTNDITIKEFKDVVSIIDTLDNKKDTNNSQTNITIAIQNLVKGFNDDC